mmetsp:Transcript_4282/g.5268  ORF Transcript_4282/g.5268 Transcript_4282/m.5268 type:complete len:571 (+) Transcript_4282:65-1777(+)
MNTKHEKTANPLNRTKTITRHLTNASDDSVQPFGWSSLDNPNVLRKLIENLPSTISSEGYDIADHLAGPMLDKERFPNGWIDVFLDFRKYQITGENHIGIAEYQKMYGGKDGLSANIVIPSLSFGREGPHDSGKRSMPVVTQEVIISNPEDAKRIARIHVKKQPNFTPLFYNSIISTTDNEEWKDMREHIVTAFLPNGSLQKIFPVTLERAKKCAKRLENLRMESKDGLVNMNDFLLYETEAQLQLALFGMSNEWMEETNEQFRNSMAGKIDPLYARHFIKQLVDNMHEGDYAGPASQGVGSDKSVRGPLSDALRSISADGKADAGNGFIFAFAGHDTTGHTLTWLLFELARNPEIQKKLQQEVDEFYNSLNGREMTYADLKELKYMTKCIFETLRLWPAVANGTFREIQFDDTIKGPNGKDVMIPKGTFCRIINWSRHRNPDLWGADAETFNPDREWKESEIWFDDGLRAYNPASERFSPFTFQPRDCIGKNFAHMEMRAILCFLLKDYSFELTSAYKSVDSSKFVGVNYGTMGPQDLTQPEMVTSKPGWGPPVRKPVGLFMKPVPRAK